TSQMTKTTCQHRTPKIGTPEKGHRHHPFPYRQPRSLQRGLQEIRFHRLENPKGEVCRRTPGGTGRLPCRKAFLQSPSGGIALRCERVKERTGAAFRGTV